MFYYRITTKGAGGARSDRYVEALQPAILGEIVADMVTKRPDWLKVTPVAQRTYIAATRPGE